MKKILLIPALLLPGLTVGMAMKKTQSLPTISAARDIENKNAARKAALGAIQEVFQGATQQIGQLIEQMDQERDPEAVAQESVSKAVAPRLASEAVAPEAVAPDAVVPSARRLTTLGGTAPSEGTARRSALGSSMGTAKRPALASSTGTAKRSALGSSTGTARRSAQPAF
jgi:hypothetical protein